MFAKLFYLPTTRFLTVLFVALCIAATALSFVLFRPVIDLPEGVQLVAVDGIALLPTDTVEEPDQLGTFANMQTFFDRQTVLAQKLEQPTVEVTTQSAEGDLVTQTATVRPTQLSDLPFIFWFQIGVGLFAMLIGGWVFSLRRDLAVTALLMLGLGLQISAAAAAIYSSRQLAIPGDLFRQLSDFNHLGTAIFGTSLVAVFMAFPRKLVNPKWLLLLIAVYSIFHLSDTLRWTDTPIFPIAIISQLALSIGFGIIQWRASRHEPLDRAGLRWFSLCTFSGCVLFVMLSVVPTALGLTQKAVVSQGYAFGFFGVIHIGLALGVSRYKLFSLDRFSYLIWLWLGGAALIFTIDFVLLIWLQNQPWASLAIALFAGSFLYFPLRQFLLTRFLAPKTASIVGKVPDVIEVGLAPTRALRREKWDGLLHDIFQPASEIETIETMAQDARISQGGLALIIPPVHDLQARRLRYATLGRRLFNASDVDLVRTLTHICNVVMDSRDAFVSGVTEERERISRDVHDNIGAQLLSALHTPQEDRKDEMLRDTLLDLRTIVNEGFQSQVGLQDLLLDLRNEMAERVEVQDVTLEWPLPDLTNPYTGQVPYGSANELRSILREITSNVLKHAGASKITVKMDVQDAMIAVSVTDDGNGFDADSAAQGNGLGNIDARVSNLGGTAQIKSSAQGTEINFDVQYAPVADDARAVMS